MAKFEPFWQVKIAVFLAGLGAGLPPAHKKAEVAVKPARPPFHEAAVTAELPAIAEPTAFEVA